MDIDFIRFTQSLVSAINQTMKIIFHGATPIGFVILMCFQHFINSSLPFPIYEIIFYTDSVYPRCWKNFVFINFSNIRDKAGKEFLFISWLYHGNLSVSLKTRNILCIQNLPYQKDWKIWESQKKECRYRSYPMPPVFPAPRLAIMKKMKI